MIVPQAAADTQARILTEAERLFRHYGYAKTTMADIAEGCQMSAANLYRFFPSKLALVEAICARILSETERRLFEIVRMEKPAAWRLQRLIEETYQNTLENLLDHRKVHELAVVAMEENWQAIKAHLGRVRLYIEEIIKSGMASGEFAQQDSMRAATWVQSAMACLCHPVLVAQKLDDETRTTPTEMAAFIVRALTARI
ncbi:MULTISPECIES: TetR/AcrR family transcriptional regulator [Rhodomicrobium]|uniref:TetR/AcrR family transcriptional regulator n=1 Tax=Rhodomicrobium TaxID=1068 RepID=UPI000B4BCEDB|nr:MULTISPECIES: TetR/AcrR family transcriptional regulator [Rhodomicrobium]